MDLIVGLLGMALLHYGVSAKVTAMAIKLVPLAVKMVEQQLTHRPNDEKRATAIEAVKAGLPPAVAAIPGLDKRIGKLVDNVVKALPSTFNPVAPKQTPQVQF